MKDNDQRKITFINNIIKPENLTNLIAFIIAIILGYRSIKSGAIQDYFQAVLAILGILALSQLVASYSAIQRDGRMKYLSKEIEFLKSKLTISNGIFKIRSAFQPIDEVLKDAKQIDILGVSLVGIATTYVAVLQNRKDSGSFIRLIFANPNNKELARNISKAFPEASSAKMHIDHAQTTMNALKNIRNQSELKCHLEFATIDSIPPFGLLIIDGNSPNGKLRVELYPHRCPVAERPIIELKPDRDNKWYNFFRMQFELYWETANKVVS